MTLTACSDPLRDVPRLADVEVAKEAGQAEALASPQPEAIADGTVAPDSVLEAEKETPKRGLLGFLRGRADAAKVEEPGSEADVADDIVQQDVEAAVATQTEDGPPAEVIAAAAPPQAAADTETKPRGGLLGGLFAGGGTSGDRDAPARRNTRAPKPGDPDYEQVGPGVTLPYGKIARLCGVSAARLGKKTDSYPARGRGYTVYDSKPGSTGLRNFYITGFDDGCARQFSAALVVFGAPQTYEQLRYSPAGKTMPVAETDRAYERVKSKVCRVGSGKPCGSRMDRLAKTTVFVSVYERFGGAARWKNLLLHDGGVEALDVKSN
ncbi:hypothetical protein [Thalassococcus lentus]|uniref:Uncharacterized protein n=1 Tax=Thalassococcus lentus TaxID=1210524 RepID=A0ABT4XTN9_9RHOB|nr:hypothetical protein [Thalassococcus lentus]MDA7425203.1 hypothetical protein [Thalassococcus lentus]